MVLESNQLMYLEEKSADVWFLIDGERIPAHKSILAAKSDYYKTMFYGSLPEGDEINMNEANISAESFKEFLKFFYLVKPNLKMENIDKVMNMAKISLSNEIFTKCEDFLKKSLTTDTAFVLRLALLYDSQNLMDAICLNAERVLESSGFLELPFEYFHRIIQFESLACEEKDIFIAGINWAKAECKRQNLNPSNGVNVRNQLQDSMYQIRFTSMTKEEASVCIALCPGLFTANELQEIICMVGHNDAYQPKLFSWMPRRFNLKYNTSRQLLCSRFCVWCGGTVCRICYSKKSVNNTGNTQFRCNQRVFLLSFSSISDRQTQRRMNVQINRINSNGDISELYSESLTVRYDYNPIIEVCKANITLNKAILLQPNYTYDICIKFEQDSFNIYPIDTYSTHRILVKKVRVDHDIVFQFNQNGGISGLSFSRVDDKNYLKKIIQNPNSWVLMIYACFFIANKLWGQHFGEPQRLIAKIFLASSLSYMLTPKIMKLLYKKFRAEPAYP